MRKRKNSLIYFLIVLSAASVHFVSCSVGRPDAGSLDGNTYENEFFKFSLDIPEGWHALNNESMNQLNEDGREMMAGNDRNLSASLKASEKNTFNLIMAFQEPFGAPVPFNPSIGCVAENMSVFPGIKSGKDYLENAKKVMNMGQIKWNFPEEIKMVNIADKEFYVLRATLNMGDIYINQEYYTTIAKDHALSVLITYKTFNQYRDLKKAIDSIYFY